ncbi:MAG: hypothetical protein K0S54_3278 [Alphaproteobacteria bacterium]|nr:hypothetical protein [Alphaproteobacteria bacterium]
MALVLAIAGVMALAGAILIWRLPSLGALLGNHDLMASLMLFIVGGGLIGAAIVRIALP